MHLAAFVDRLAITLIFPVLKTTLKVGDAQLGLLEGSAFALSYGLSSPVFGRLGAYFSRKRLILFGLVVWTVAALASGLAQNLSQFILARMVMGLGEAALAPAALSLLAAQLDRDALGRAVSVFTAGATLGKSVALLGGGALLGLLDALNRSGSSGGGRLASWRAMLILIASPNLLLIAGWLFIREPKGGRPVGRAKPWAALEWFARHRRAFILHVVAAVIPVLIIQSLAAWAPSFYVRAFSLGSARAGVFVGVAVLIGAPLGHLLGGTLIDTLGGARGGPGLVICLGLLASLSVAILCLLAHQLDVSLAAYSVLVMLLGMCGPAGLAGLQSMSPDLYRSEINGLFYVVVALIGLGVAPPLVGWLSDHVFPQRQGLAYALLSLLAPSCVVGAAIAWISRKPWRLVHLASLSMEKQIATDAMDSCRLTFTQVS